MEFDEKQLQKRFLELASRADARNTYTFTQFLTLAEQDVLLRLEKKLACPCTLDGGFEGAERKLAIFGSEERFYYPPESPICCLRIAPKSKKFCGDLTHRDYLGSLMGLGIKRELLGDLVLTEGACYLFCLEEIADFICMELTQAGRITVCAARSEPPEQLFQPPEPDEIVVASPRIDACIAGAFHLSRSESAALFPHGLVQINGRPTENPSADLSEGAVVSVRGHGRFRFDGALRETKKGRLRISIFRYGEVSK